VRLGLRLVFGLKTEFAERTVAARTEHPFQDAQGLAHRARLDQQAMKRLAADPLQSLSGHRRQQVWDLPRSSLLALIRPLLTKRRLQTAADLTPPLGWLAAGRSRDFHSLVMNRLVADTKGSDKPAPLDSPLLPGDDTAWDLFSPTHHGRVGATRATTRIS
jgi:hypothetical protein